MNLQVKSENNEQHIIMSGSSHDEFEFMDFVDSLSFSQRTVIDMSQCYHISSGGIYVLTKLRDRLKENKKKLIILDPEFRLHKELKKFGFDGEFTLKEQL